MDKQNKSENIREKAGLLLKSFAARRKEIPRQVRNLATLLLAGISIALLGALAWSYNSSGEQEIENVTYYCMQEAVFDYRVHMVPNDFFEDRVLEPGKAYMTELTDEIIVDFEYHFVGEEEAEISGEYAIFAVLEAHTAEQEYLVWDKEFELLSEESFSKSGSDYSVEEEVAVPFREYLQFTNEVREETGYSPAELNLTVRADITADAETGDGSIQEALSPVMKIPMGGSTFTVGGNLMDERESQIKETVTVAGTDDESNRALYAGGVTAAAIGLVLLRLLTVPAKDKTPPQAKQVERILKKNKERIVVTANGVTTAPPGAITVQSFDELLKLADEIGKPILYPQHGVAGGSEHIFLIFTPEQVYAYSIKEETDASFNQLESHSF